MDDTVRLELKQRVCEYSDKQCWVHLWADEVFLEEELAAAVEIMTVQVRG